MTNVHLLRVLVMMTTTISSARPWTLLSNSSRLHCIVVWAEVDFPHGTSFDGTSFVWVSFKNTKSLAGPGRQQPAGRAPSMAQQRDTSMRGRAYRPRIKPPAASALREDEVLVRNKFQGRHAHYPTCGLTHDPQCALFMCCQTGAGADGTAAQSRQQEPQYRGCKQQSAHPCATRAGVSAHASPS